MKTLSLLITTWLLASCSAAPPRVQCERHLVPINPQAAAAPVPAVSP